ncbi:MAG: hypothetical protein LBI53_08270 [Candidatus Peribacteria bacterium]|nr:hypothetical protein [Candidatus Peribacteria bacterium]
MDVIMRRLDGDENSIYKATNTPLDKKGEERRDEINGIAESVQGNTPERISRQYQNYRKQS